MIKFKGYYLVGEIPYRNKYLFEMKDYNSIMSSTNYNSHKNNYNKNEYIQCDSVNNNNYSKNSLKYNFIDIRKLDMKIEKLAKNLKLRLNLEDKKNDNQTKCGCGNLITLKNGFFNGVNLVMNYSTMKEKDENSKIICSINSTENKNNINTTQTVIVPNGYNFIPTNLPIFLRDKYNIKGTTVLSPFCIEARDDFLFKKIFYENEKRRQVKMRNYIDNKFNIFYAENQTQFDKNLTKYNAKLRKKGKKVLHEVGPSSIEKKLKKIRNKMSFMRKIIDYAYPNMVLARVRESEKIIKKRNLSQQNLPPFIKAEIINKQRNNNLGNFLRQSINIKNQ